MARAAEEALTKIASVLPEGTRHRADQVEIHAFAPKMTPQVRERIDALERAAEQRRRLELSYRDAEDRPTERTVRPLGLWFWGKVWTLVAWCELRADFRMFRLDRIDRMTDTDETFRPERGKTLTDFYRTMEDCPPDRQD
tara:strand:+ start:143 stop:562 length:420 start_codon:yes stop_codon:yes gene_type:complete